MSKLTFTKTRPIRNMRSGSGTNILAKHLRSKGVPSSKAARFAVEVKNAMARSKKTPGLNASSMADIAFLMLIFFLMTSTMNVDTGIMRILPPPLPEDIEVPDINKRNVMNVLISSQDRLLVN